MARTIKDFLFEGNGFRVSWNDGKTDQYVWSGKGGTLTLLNGGKAATQAQLEELKGAAHADAFASSATLHLLGGADEHLEATNTTQANVALAQNTWTRVTYDTAVLASHDGGISFDSTTGIVTLPYGEWRITAAVTVHDSSGTVTPVFIQLYDEDLGQEVPYSFVPMAKPSAANAPVTLTTRTLLVNSSSSKRISVRVQSSATTTQLGVHSSNLPAGSTNTISKLLVERIG